MPSDIIQQLKNSGLRGRGGAGFPTGQKWEIFKNAKSDKKYIILNAAEGDPQMSKDGYLLTHHLKDVIEGIKIALKTFPRSKGYIYLRNDYHKKFKKLLQNLTADLPISLFKKPGEYLAGEETSLIEAIEGRKPEPRMRPPYPTEAGLFGKPTLINNVETFYFVAKIAEGKYQNERFYCLSGDIKKKGVFKLREGMSIKKILEATNNLPKDDFFVQAGGVFGEFLLPSELNQPIRGLASVLVYKRKWTNPLTLAKKIIHFAIYQNCDKCTPCREGVYRLFEELNKKKSDKKTLQDVFLVLEETSYCPLGNLVADSISSLFQKIINHEEGNKVKN